MALLSLAFTNSHYFSSVPQISIKIDTTVIEHKLDGIINEWPSDKFSTDKETNIQYALDNDSQNLYLVMSINSQVEQMQLMLMGMKLFIDMKGKRKENKGVEFPLKKNDGSSFSRGVTLQSDGQKNEQEEKLELKRIRRVLATTLINMKLFGFTKGEPFKQNLDIAESVKIAYDWDSTEVMHIEYLVPLNILGDTPSLAKKIISIGWKINGNERPSGSIYFSRRPSRSDPPGDRPPSVAVGRRPGSGNVQGGMGKILYEKELWTKYTLLHRAEPMRF